MVLCKHTHTHQDGCGELEFFCIYFERRMDMDVLEKCRSCSKYKKM